MKLKFGNLICFLAVLFAFVIPTNVKGAQPDYTVRYYSAAGDEQTISTEAYSAGNQLVLPSEAGTREGYQLNGWYVCNNPEVSYSLGQYVVLDENEGDYYDLCAIWEREVIYNLDGGVNNEANIHFINYHESFTLLNPTKVGYTFDGWYSDSEYNNRITVINGNENTAVYAKWNVNKYSIRYDKNGGTGEMSNSICEFNTSCGVQTNIYVKLGYNFTNWNTKADGTGAVYASGGTVFNLTNVNNGEVVLYAIYEPIQYGIEYYLNGGVNNTNNPIMYTIESETITLQNPTRENYRFTGWYTDSACTNRVTTIPKGSTEVKRFYASWEAVDYDIEYVLNGGDNSLNNPGGYSVENPTIELSNPTRKGFVFGGWYSDSGFKNKVTSIPTGSSGKKTLYAQWVKSSYKINYKSNGGKGKMSATTCKANKNCTLRGNSFKRTGYTFVEWNTKANGTGVSYTNKQVVQNITSGSSITLYAIWKPIVYKIKFAANGATTGSMEIIECTYGKNCTLTANAFARTGYKYGGWNTKANGKGKNYKNNQVVKNLASSAKTVTLYAKWSKIKYSIKYNLNGGKNNKKNPGSYYVTTATINFKNPTRSGYGFLGWYTDKEFTNKVTSIPKGSTGNVVLYAKWVKTAYKISFATNGGSGKMKTISCKINKNCALTKNAFTRKGYTFVGWNTKADGTGTSYGNKANVNLAVAADTKLYAIWDRQKLVINFNGNGNTSGSMSSITCYYGDNCTLPSNQFSRDDFKFNGWNTKADGKGTNYSNGQVLTKNTKTGTMTLYAKWKTTKTFYASKTYLSIPEDKTGSVTITNLDGSKMNCQSQNKYVATCSWGSWNGYTIPMVVTAVGYGSTTVIVRNLDTNQEIVIDVDVTANNYQKIQTLLNNAQREGDEAYELAEDSHNRGYSMSYLTYLYVDGALRYLREARDIVAVTPIPKISSYTYQAIRETMGYDAYSRIYGIVEAYDLIYYIDSAIEVFEAAAECYDSNSSFYSSYIAMGNVYLSAAAVYSSAVNIEVSI